MFDKGIQKEKLIKEQKRDTLRETTKQNRDKNGILIEAKNYTNIERRYTEIYRE